MPQAIILATVLCITQLQVHVVVMAEEPGPCQFCARGEITLPEKSVSIPGFEMTDVSCGTIDTFLPRMLKEGSPECDLVQSMGTLCGCPTREDSCSFCPDGSAVPYPEKQVTFFAPQFDGFAPTCEMVEAFTASLSTNDEICSTIFQQISGYCGCPPRENYCKFCNGQPLKEEFYNVELPFLRSEKAVELSGTGGIDITPTCEAFYALQYQVEHDVAVGSYCYGSQYATIHCGCNDGQLYYHGTSDIAKHAVIVWLSRAVGLLSLCASILVLIDILRDPKKRRGSTYHQLVGTASVFDMITSIVWMVGPAAVNANSPDTKLDSGIYGANGNTATCRAQAYFYQLGTEIIAMRSDKLTFRSSNMLTSSFQRTGLTSVWINVSLTAYFMLVVVFGYRERLLKRKKLWLIGVPLGLGFALSFAAIPAAGLAFTHCQFFVDGPYKYFFGIVPILGSTFSILLMLIIIYCTVRRQGQRQGRWGFNATEGGSSPTPESSIETIKRNKKRKKAAHQSKLEKMVFWQCLAYAAAFCVTWPILCVTLIKAFDNDLPYGFWVFITATSAMQGFNNALCYFRLVTKNPCAVFLLVCNDIRKRLVCDCCRRVGRQPERLVSIVSFDRLYRSTIDPRSIDAMTSVDYGDHGPNFDPAVELANLSVYEEEDARNEVTSTSEITECAAGQTGHHISQFDVVLGNGIGDHHVLSSIQSSVDDMEQHSVDDALEDIEQHSIDGALDVVEQHAINDAKYDSVPPSIDDAIDDAEQGGGPGALEGTPANI